MAETPEIKFPTLEGLPQEFQKFKKEFYEFAQLVIANLKELQPQADRWFNLDELCDYLPNKPAKSCIYGYVNTRSIPFHKTPGQKPLRFLKSEIDAWLLAGSRMPSVKNPTDVTSYLIPKRKKKIKQK